MFNRLFISASSVLPLDVAGAITQAFEQNVKPQFMSIVDSVVMPLICAVLLVALVVKAVFTWKSYREGNAEVNFAPVIILFVCLVVAVSATAWMWNVIGW